MTLLSRSLSAAGRVQAFDNYISALLLYYIRKELLGDAWSAGGQDMWIELLASVKPGSGHSFIM